MAKPIEKRVTPVDPGLANALNLSPREIAFSAMGGVLTGFNRGFLTTANPDIVKKADKKKFSVKQMGSVFSITM